MIFPTPVVGRADRSNSGTGLSRPESGIAMAPNCLSGKAIGQR